MDYVRFGPQRPARTPWQILIIAVIVVLMALGVGANGVRGTDQHLYVADVETLMRGEEPVTNLYYPAKILREADGTYSPNYFLHNGLMLHIVAAVGKTPGAYNAWIALNLFFHCMVALVVLLVSRRVADANVSYWVTAIYLVSPIAIWQTLNVLQEMYFSAITALLLLATVNRMTVSGKIILGFSLVVGVLSHPMFILVGMLFAIFGFYTLLKKKSLPVLFVSLGLFPLILVAPYLNKWLFPSVFQPDLKAIVTGSVPGVSHMLWHYSDLQVPIDGELLYKKIRALFEAHIGEFRLQPMYVFTNIAMTGIVVLFLFRFKKYKSMLVPLMILFGLYLGMSVLMHPQPRFQQIISCATFVTIAICIQEFKAVMRFRLPHIAFACAIVIAFSMAFTTRKQADQDRTNMAKLGSEFSLIGNNAKIVSFDIPLPMKFSQAIRPRPLLSLMTEFLDAESIDRVLEEFAPEYAVSIDPVDRRDYVLVDKIDDRMNGVLYLYRIWDIRITETM